MDTMVMDTLAAVEEEVEEEVEGGILAAYGAAYKHPLTMDTRPPWPLQV
jgi:hypothetical protein